MWNRSSKTRRIRPLRCCRAGTTDAESLAGGARHFCTDEETELSSEAEKRGHEDKAEGRPPMADARRTPFNSFFSCGFCIPHEAAARASAEKPDTRCSRTRLSTCGHRASGRTVRARASVRHRWLTHGARLRSGFLFDFFFFNSANCCTCVCLQPVCGARIFPEARHDSSKLILSAFGASVVLRSSHVHGRSIGRGAAWCVGVLSEAMFLGAGLAGAAVAARGVVRAESWSMSCLRAAGERRKKKKIAERVRGGVAELPSLQHREVRIPIADPT